MSILPTSQATQQHYDLYERYINERHADGDMYPATLDQFEKFLVHSCTESFFIELWDDQKLIAVSTCDLMDDGLSAVYTFLILKNNVVHLVFLRFLNKLNMSAL
jgi:arginine-tRNA-protein transferase